MAKVRIILKEVLNRQTSKYNQKMTRLSSKIFNEYYFPELTPAQLDYSPQDKRNFEFFVTNLQHLNVVKRNMEKPADLDPTRNAKYYVPHPQIRELTHRLREYGLFRDEHRDFNEAMKALTIARKGDTSRKRRGPISKKK